MAAKKTTRSHKMTKNRMVCAILFSRAFKNE